MLCQSCIKINTIYMIHKEIVILLCKTTKTVNQFTMRVYWFQIAGLQT